MSSFAFNSPVTYAFLVLFLGYRFQMLRVHASSVTAGVVYMKTVRYCAIRIFISQTMLPVILTVPVLLNIPAGLGLAMTHNTFRHLLLLLLVLAGSYGIQRSMGRAVVQVYS